MSETEFPSLNQTVHRDRSTLIVIAGIIVVLGGCLCGLFVPLMIFGQMMVAKSQGVEASFRPVIPAIMIYGGLAVWFVVLGLGAAMKRRWAGQLLHSVSWLWLAIGVMSTVIMGVVFAAMGTSIFGMPGGKELPREALWIGLAVAGAVIILIYLVIPALLLLVFGNRNVRATFQARDPLPRWTDPLPTAVLALAILLAFGGVSMFGVFAYTPVVPLFGILVSGMPAGLLMIAFSILWLCLAVGVTRLRPWAWWTALGSIVVFALSAVITFSRFSLIEMYRRMDFPADQLAQIEKTGILESPWMPWVTVLSVMPFLALLFAVRKHFRFSIPPAS